MADNTHKWEEARRLILEKLDIRKEYEALGVVPLGSPNKNGWIQCRGVVDRSGNEDKTPSAGFNVGDGKSRGRYKDFGGTGRSFNFFDFVAACGRFGGDFKSILVHYARETGVKLPDGTEDIPANKVELSTLTFGVMMNYSNGKDGVSVEAIQRLGGMYGRWPRGLTAEKQNHLITFPQFGPALLDLDPVGYHSVAANPKGSVRFYKGPGQPEEFRKSVQIGDPGLMNVFGLHRLQSDSKVKVVVSLEGISDLAAAEDICPTDGEWVTTATGGCKYYLDPDSLKHFIGKELWIVRDQGDTDGAGEAAAKVDAAAAVAAGITTRIIKLPTSAGEKMDFRKWKCEGHTWADFVELALTFDPIKVEETDGINAFGRNLLRELGLTVIGEHEGSQRIEVFSDSTRKPATIGDIDKLTYPKLVQLVGYEKVEKLIHDGKDDVPGKVNVKQVKLAIAAEASGKSFSDNERIGSGIWNVDGKTLLVKAKEYGIIEGTKIERSHMPFYRGRIIDLGAKVPDWCDFGQAQRYIQAAQDEAWCRRVFEEAVHIFRQWYWKYAPSPEVVASLICSTWVQTLWPWRPEVVITGSSDTGKSMLLKDTVAEGIFGQIAMYVTKPTEAAIRQHIRHHGTILLMDEFEHDQHREAVLKLLRTASRGGAVYRGTSDQKGAKFSLSVLPWMAAIETGLRDTADVNRVIILDLMEIPKEARGKQNLPSQSQLRDLGLKLMAVGIRYQRTAAAFSEYLRGQTYDGTPGRVVESFSIPNGMISAIYGHSTAEAAEYAGRLLGAWDFVGQQTKDETRLLSEILTAEVLLEGGRRMTVNQILHTPSTPDTREALHRVGLGRVHKRSKKRHVGDQGTPMLFVAHDVVRRTLLSRSAFATQTIDQYLNRVEDSMRDRQRLGGAHPIAGVCIPMETLDKLFPALEDDGEEAQEEAEHDELLAGLG